MSSLQDEAFVALGLVARMTLFQCLEPQLSLFCVFKSGGNIEVKVTQTSRVIELAKVRIGMTYRSLQKVSASVYDVT